jgi:hypothetical protein
MPADSTENITAEQQAIKSLNYLSPDDKSKVLEYIASLIALEKVKNDQTSTPQN